METRLRPPKELRALRTRRRRWFAVSVPDYFRMLQASRPNGWAGSYHPTCDPNETLQPVPDNRLWAEAFEQRRWLRTALFCPNVDRFPDTPSWAVIAPPRPGVPYVDLDDGEKDYRIRTWASVSGIAPVGLVLDGLPFRRLHVPAKNIAGPTHDPGEICGVIDITYGAVRGGQVAHVLIPYCDKRSGSPPSGIPILIMENRTPTDATWPMVARVFREAQLEIRSAHSPFEAEQEIARA